MRDRVHGHLYGALPLALLGLALVVVPTAQASGPHDFYALPPCRVVDTRNANGPTGGPVLAANSSRSFPVLGSCGIPVTAKAVVFNVTVVTPTDWGDIRMYPAGLAMPLVSVLNWSTADYALANGAVIPVKSGTGDHVTVHVDMLPGSTGTVHLVLDVSGYFE